MITPDFCDTYVRPCFNLRTASSKVTPDLRISPVVFVASAGDFAVQNFWNATSVVEDCPAVLMEAVTARMAMNVATGRILMLRSITP